MKFRDLLKSKRAILTDGAMGTYYMEVTGSDGSKMCEMENLENPQLIRDIHRSYINAGAKLIRTNTFSANSKALGLTHSELSRVIDAGYDIAVEAARGKACVLCDIGTLRVSQEDNEKAELEEYFHIIDRFLAKGAKAFIFETQAKFSPLDKLFRYIKQRDKDADIIASFALLPEGRTQLGVPLISLLEDLRKNRKYLSAAGLNCGCGPTHLNKYAKEMVGYAKINLGLPVMVMPNAGFPYVENQRTVFYATPKYFAKKTAAIAKLGVDIIGGCCGTTPKHIEYLNRELSSSVTATRGFGYSLKVNTASQVKAKNFEKKLRNNSFVVAAELDAPYSHDMSKMEKSAQILRDSQKVDVITISDAPMARPRIDSIVSAAIIKSKVDIDVLPHLCCRDKNINALKASILAARACDINNILAVTGDKVSPVEVELIKPVFNTGSIGLLELISNMNQDVLADSPLCAGAALNPNAKKQDKELDRAKKKIKAGAKFFLTQPVFEENFDLIDEVRKQGAKVLVGVMPLVSFRNAAYMNNEVPGIDIPGEYLDMFEPGMSREEATKVGVQIAVRVAESAVDHADGLYFITPFNRARVVCEALRRLRLR